jgi:hypothetical protein
MHIDIIIAFVVILVAACYGIPALENWKAKRAAEKRLREVIKH